MTDRARRRPAVTLEDVAREAGVSRATASRALLETGPASTPARAAVRAVAERMGFRPDPAARALAGGPGTRIAVVAVGAGPDVLECAYVQGVATGAATAADRHGLGVALRWVPPRGGGLLADLAADRSVHGVVLANTSWPVLGAAAAALPGRVVSIGVGDDAVPSVDVDNLGGATALLRALLGEGRRRIAMVEPPADNPAAGRLTLAYRRVVAAAGAPARTVPGGFDDRDGRAGAAAVLDRWPDTDAIFAPNDRAALGVLAALRARGVRVPDDVAVAGFGADPLVGLAAPELLSATQPTAQIAAAAVEVLVGRTGGHRLHPSVPVLRRSA